MLNNAVRQFAVLRRFLFGYSDEKANHTGFRSFYSAVRRVENFMRRQEQAFRVSLLPQQPAGQTANNTPAPSGEP